MRDAWEDAIIEQAADMVSDGLAVLGRPLADTRIVVIPYQRRPVTATPPAKRARFVSALDQLIDTAFSDDPGPPDPAYDAADHPAGVAIACRLCQGSCCVRGGDDNAYLEVPDIQRFRRANPGATKAEIRKAYCDLLPETSALSSCIYHGPVGCTLPRVMRSKLCNTFMCRGQRQLAEGQASGDTAAIMIGAPRDRPVAAAAFSRDTGYSDLARRGAKP